MSKIRFPEINAAIEGHERYSEFMEIMAEMYTASPNKGQIAFIYAVQDQFRANVRSQSRTAGGSSRGSGWRNEQIAQFSGRGNKWIKVTGVLKALVEVALTRYETEDGEDPGDYRRWIEKAGFAWIRYAGPRGSEASPELCFEVRIYGSRLDHPNQLLKIPAQFWDENEADRSLLGGTPFSQNLEV